MPGIFGFILKDRADKEYARNLIEGMGRLQNTHPSYRANSHHADWYGLGEIGIPLADFVRHKINDQLNLAAVHDGYIYGYEGIADGPYPDQLGDLIVRYREQGEEIVPRVNGSFNLALFDREKKEALIFNDCLGHRMLHYFEDDEIFLFASEFKSFYAYDKFKPDLDRQCAIDFFNYFFPMGDRTFLKGVRRLPWGHTIRWTDGKIKIGPYHEFEFSDNPDFSLDDFIEEADAVYRDNLKRQLKGAKRIIIPLSGGLDSRMVLGHASRAELPIHTYTHGTKGCLDEKVSRKVARAAGIENHRLVEVDPLWVVDKGEKLIFLTGGVLPTVPVILMGVLETYGEDHDKAALLNGISGRTAFGYGYFNVHDITTELTLEQKIKRLRRPLFGEILDDNYYNMFVPDIKTEALDSYEKSIERELSKYLPVSDMFCHQRDLFMLANRYRRNFDMVDINRHFWHDHMALEDNRTFELYKKIPPRIKAYPTRAVLVETLKKKFPHLASVPTQNTGVDLFSTPSAFRKLVTKYKKKAAYYSERLSGGMLKFEDKKTYVHFNQWYREYPRIREMYEDVLLSDSTISRGFFNRSRIEEIMNRQKRGGNSFNDLALLLTFEQFCRIYIDNPDFDKFLVR